MPSRAKAWAVAHPYVLAVLSVAVATGLFIPGRPHFAKEQWALLYLLIVALIARAGGARPAILASVLAFFAWNFFLLPPYHTLLIADPQDWLALGVFLVVGTVVGIQTGRLREREARALAREHESNLIAQLSAYLVSEASSESMGQTVVADVRRLIDATSVALFVRSDEGGRVLARSPHEGPDPAEGVLASARWVLAENRALNLPPVKLGPTAGSEPAKTAAENPLDTVMSLPAERSRSSSTASQPAPIPAAALECPDGCDPVSIYLPLRTGSQAQGVLAVGPRLGDRPYRQSQLRLLVSVANVVAAFLDRQRLLEQAARTEAAREADVLKSSLLSSVSHELKTPLAALTATVSNLLEGDTEWDEEAVREELRAIVADVARLNNSIGSLLDLSRLEAHAWTPHREWYEIEDIVLTGLEALPVHQRSRVSLDIPADFPPLLVDYVQLSRVFQNLLENAVLYSGEGTPVTVGARAENGDAVIWVEDHGRGIRPEEKTRIFEKFYRSKEAGVATPSGTGLGLAIAREIVHANGGVISVEDAQPHGARFVVELRMDGTPIEGDKPELGGPATPGPATAASTLALPTAASAATGSLRGQSAAAAGLPAEDASEMEHR